MVGLDRVPHLGQAAQAGDGVEANQLLPQGGLLLVRRPERRRRRHRRRQHQHRVPGQQVVHVRANPRLLLHGCRSLLSGIQGHKAN